MPSARVPGSAANSAPGPAARESDVTAAIPVPASPRASETPGSMRSEMRTSIAVIPVFAPQRTATLMIILSRTSGAASSWGGMP